MSDFYIPEDLEEMVKNLVAIEELEKIMEENQEEFERAKVEIDDFIDELKRADYIDPDLWNIKITI
jgi:hypothetical protein